MFSTTSNVPAGHDSIADDPTKQGRFSRLDWVFVVLIIVSAVIAYLPAMRGDLLWDDGLWVTDVGKDLSDWAGLWKMWASPTTLQQYYPLAGTSFWLDHQFWGFWTTPYHVENVLWHALSALLFWRLLENLQVRGAKLAAAIFALHPVMVESVGWIAERKNVMSMALFLASLLAYGRYCGFWRQDAELRPKWGAYAGALALFVGALLAKITAFVFPPAVLLLCWWKRGRVRLKQDVLPTLPFFVLAVGLGYFISWLEKHHVGAGAELTTPERLLVAARVPWFYAAKLLWPADVSFMYPRWNLDAHSVVSWLVVAGSILSLVGLWVLRGRLGRGFTVAVLFFVGALFPVLGIFDVYGMHFSFVADRWVYFSSLALIAVIASGLTWALRSAAPWARYVGTAGLLGALMMLTWRHSALLKDSETLWTGTAHQSPTSWKAWSLLGGVQLDRQRFEEARVSFQKAIELWPTVPESRVHIGTALAFLGRLDEAIVEYHKAISLISRNTGKSIVSSAYFDLAETLRMKGEMDEALVNYQKAVDADEKSPANHVVLGNMLVDKGRLDEALAQYQRVLKLRTPRSGDLGNVANVLVRLARFSEAVSYYDAALMVDPGNAMSLNNFSRLLASNPDQKIRAMAVDLAQRLNQSTKGKNPDAFATLAVAYASCGKFADAIQSIDQAKTLATSQGKTALADSFQGQRKLFEAGRQGAAP